VVRGVGFVVVTKLPCPCACVRRKEPSGSRGTSEAFGDPSGGLVVRVSERIPENVPPTRADASSVTWVTTFQGGK
jgi:hypothetical protein